MTDRRWTLWLIWLAILARAAAVLVLQSHLVPNSTYEHGEIAANLLAGRGFSTHFLGVDGPTSQQAPLYPFVVAAAYAIGGVGTPNSLLILELAQAFLGGWLVAEVIRLARAIAPETKWVPRLAGFIVAIHPTLVYAATHVQVAPIATLLLVASLARAYEARTLKQAGCVGLWLAALILTDPILGMVSLACVWIIAMRRTEAMPFFRSAALMGFVTVVGISPWIVRNYRVHGEFVFIKSTFGYAFWQGNCSISEGTDKVVRASVETKLAQSATNLKDLNRSLWAARHEAGYLDDIALTKADYERFASVSEPERSRILLRRAFDDLKQAPGRYFELTARRLRYFFLFDETNPKTRNRLYRVSQVGLSLAAIVGLILTSGSLRNRLRPTFLTVGLIAGFHSLTIVSARFHIPIEPLLAVWASMGIARFSTATDSSAEVKRVIFGHGFDRRIHRLGLD
jgi:hypothetical protein